VVFHQYRKGTLRGAYQPANNPEIHNLVASQGFPQTAYPPQSYAQDYPAKTAYYDQQAAAQTQAAYSGMGYSAQAYGQQPVPHPQQQGYEMQPRQGV
jgi:hypothetical protein